MRRIVLLTVRAALFLTISFLLYQAVSNAAGLVRILDSATDYQLGHKARSLIIGLYAIGLTSTAACLVIKNRVIFSIGALLGIAIFGAKIYCLASIIQSGVTVPCDCIPGSRASLTLEGEARSAIPLSAAIAASLLALLIVPSNKGESELQDD